MPNEVEQKIGEQMANEIMAHFEELRVKILLPRKLSTREEGDLIKILNDMLDLNKHNVNYCSTIKGLLHAFEQKKRIRSFLPRLHAIERFANENIIDEIIDSVEARIEMEETKHGMNAARPRAFT